MDRVAAHADGIVIVGRIKSHTDFRGEYESGLLKMAVVGLGKQQGAEIFHHGGPEHMAENLLRFGKVVLDKAPILFGCAIIENAYGEIASIELIPRAEIGRASCRERV